MADPRTSTPACGVWALPVCPVLIRVSFFDRIWLPDHLTRTSLVCWVLVGNQKTGWGPLRRGLESEASTLLNPHLWVTEHLARSNLHERSGLNLKLHQRQISNEQGDKPLCIKWTRRPWASSICPLRSMQPQPQSVVKVEPSSGGKSFL